MRSKCNGVDTTFFTCFGALKSGACDMVSYLIPLHPPLLPFFTPVILSVFYFFRYVCVCEGGGWGGVGSFDPKTDHKASGIAESRHCEGHHVDFWSCDHQRVTLQMHIKNADCQTCECVCVYKLMNLRACMCESMCFLQNLPFSLCITYSGLNHISPVWHVVNDLKLLLCGLKGLLDPLYRPDNWARPHVNPVFTHCNSHKSCVRTSHTHPHRGTHQIMD